MSEDGKLKAPGPVEPVRVKLRHPLKGTDDSVVLGELVIKRPTGKEMMKMPYGQGLETGDMLKLGLRCAGQPESYAEKLDFDDVIEVVAAVEKFFLSGQTTGEKASP